MLIAGVDEAGTGAAAGPFTVGVAVFDTEEPPFDGLRDSKKLTEARRYHLKPLIEEHAIEYCVGWDANC